MIIDELLEFADAVDISGSAGTALVGDVIDLGATPQDLGNGRAMYLVLQAASEGAGGTSLQFTLASDAAEAIATDGSASEHLLTDAIPIADFSQSDRYKLVMPVPLGAGIPYERYLGVLVTRAGTITTADVNAFLTFDPSHWRSYADGQN